ncbi:MAG: GNAT family N-acetyltransferase [Stigonema ocellatum SAG 48.90 = DSM 106950]|nr:GNAT family N-acetyltransferase [Stigonema ocellatum SAG 48.90 = DSM 106950]
MFLKQEHLLLNVEISTNRLLLKPISMEYKLDIFAEFTNEITTYMYPCPAKEISETELFINDSIDGMKNENNLILVILKKDSQEFLGCTGIHHLNSKHPEIGIWLKKSAHGNSYGLETVTALQKWAKENLDYEYLVYPVDRENIPSRRIPERLGGQIFREYNKTNLSGRVLHLVEYRIYQVRTNIRV